jgi:hypothetical protein
LVEKSRRASSRATFEPSDWALPRSVSIAVSISVSAESISEVRLRLAAELIARPSEPVLRSTPHLVELRLERGQLVAARRLGADQQTLQLPDQGVDGLGRLQGGGHRADRLIDALLALVHILGVVADRLRLEEHPRVVDHAGNAQARRQAVLRARNQFLGVRQGQ